MGFRAIDSKKPRGEYEWILVKDLRYLPREKTQGLKTEILNKVQLCPGSAEILFN